MTHEGAPPGLVYKHIRDRRGYAFGSVEVFFRDVRIKRGVPWHDPRRGGGQRGAILGLSRQSRGRLMHYARNLPQLTHMLTLTYPGVFTDDGRRVKRDWATLRKWLRRAHAEIGGLWILEFQRRGAPHLHAFVNGPIPREELSRRWYEVVGSGDERHLRAGTRIELLRKSTAVASYAAKYAAKLEQKEVPREFRRPGRMWGHFNIKLPSETYSGPREDIGILVRMVRRIRDAQRRARGLRRRRDDGRLGFTAYDSADGTRQLVEWALKDDQGGTKA
jgi:hypothetical protein